jgi:trehalose 6-phosphate phosphatase
MRALGAQWPRLQQKASSAKRAWLLLDVDGTLVPIADHPSQVHLPEHARHLLKQLVGHPKVSVALISGRALRDLKALVGVSGLYYAGNHGLELQGPKLRYVHPVARKSRPLLKRIARNLKTALQAIPGAWVEEKGLTLSLHWRQVSHSAQQRFKRLVAEQLVTHTRHGAIRVTRGKRVIEVRPPIGWDKGDALARLLQRTSRSPASARSFMIYFGDDQTDEDAFRVVNRLGGVTVVVGSPTHPTAAQYRVKDCREVEVWLERLEGTWQDSHHT